MFLSLVVIGYVGAAGITVVLIICHYLVAYEPTLDPFPDENTVGYRSVPFRPNPVDLMILRYIKWPFRGFVARVFSSWTYLNTPLTSSILAVSDLQLAAGTAILISGYAQLQCGLSSYHWLGITRLAWFSSLTHLSCLPFLRNYLYKHKSQRQWRLVFMLVLVIMLTTAMVPTGGYMWTYSNSKMPGYAICLFFTPVTSGSVGTFMSMAILVSLIGLGFVFRVVKLHKPLSLFMVETLRRNISQYLRGLLWKLYRWKGHSKRPRRIAGLFLYYPALALFLSLRLVADRFSSMFFEVYWLLASFLIGLWGLLRILNIFLPSYTRYTLFGGININQWSFGQFMPVILLATPLINIIESFYPDQQTGIKTNTCASLNHSSESRIPVGITRPSTFPSFSSDTLGPDQNYYLHSTAMGVGTAYILIFELGLHSPAWLDYGHHTCLLPRRSCCKWERHKLAVGRSTDNEPAFCLWRLCGVDAQGNIISEPLHRYR
ncbi:hypothetical protein BDW72DRAFT_208869 [Aspergillus terricola var. indicus]